LREYGGNIGISIIKKATKIEIVTNEAFAAAGRESVAAFVSSAATGNT
jgi:hypothetical protein